MGVCIVRWKKDIRRLKVRVNTLLYNGSVWIVIGNRLLYQGNHTRRIYVYRLSVAVPNAAWPEWHRFVLHMCSYQMVLPICLWIPCACNVREHDDVIKWKHFPRYWPFVRIIHRSPVNSPHKGQWRGALMFSLIYARINGWVNNREAGDLRRHQAHCDVIVMGVMD